MLERNVKLDIAKCIAAVFVVWGHILSAGSAIWNFISLSHMPVFFSISGYFLYHEIRKTTFLTFLRKKAFRLLLPYIIWSFISLLFHSVLIMIQHGSITDILIEAQAIVIESRSVWFLMVLFLSVCLVAVIYKLSLLLHISEAVLMLIIYALLLVLGPNHVFNFYKFKEYFLILCAGYLFFACRESCVKDGKPIRRFPGLLAFIGIPLYIYSAWLSVKGYSAQAFQISIQTLTGDTLLQCVFWLLGSVMGIFFLLGLAGLVEKTRLANVFSIAGNYSLDIYVTHMFFLSMLSSVFSQQQRLGAWNVLALLWAILISVIIVLGSRLVLRKIGIYRLAVGEKMNNNR